MQEDKDLVHEFVQNDGLACLIKVGNEADQNYQNYILRGKLSMHHISIPTPNNDLPRCINIRFFLTLVYENTQVICIKGISIRYAIIGRKINNEAYSLFIPRWSIYLQNVN